MIKYAKVIDQETGLCEVGTGTNSEFYKSIGMIQLDVEQSEKDNQWYLAEKCPHKSKEEMQQEEKQRLQSLSMTRSDFFDGTIKAFGTDSDDLLVIIKKILETLTIDEIDKKVAINNYRNALNFYRKHTLFTLLSNVKIPIKDDLSIIITSDQWDRFFDETDKKNPYAYQELLS